jgi:alkylhydroperoxidase/carboxymuconolactone decarboxylase family protein YurZ
MAESQIQLNEERKALAQKFGQLRPDLGIHVQNTMIEAFKEGALSTKIKRLMALAIALGVGCRNCELHQATAALEEGTTLDEILEVLDVVVSIRGTTGIAESLRIIKLLDEMGKL